MTITDDYVIVGKNFLIFLHMQY